MRHERQPPCRGREAGNQVGRDGSTVVADRYTLGPVIGSGASAAVYRARDVWGDRDVAVKLFDIGLPATAQHRQQQEFCVQGKLRHCGLVPVYDGGVHQGRSYLVMPLVSGPTLAERLARGPLTVSETMRIGADIAGALSYVHRAGVTHRDLKPANVLLGPEGALLTDFSIACHWTDRQRADGGDVVGTAAYMAPEQVRGRLVGPSSDIYALGLVLLECLSGQREYPGSMIEAAVARLHRAPHVPSKIPADVAELLTRMTRQCPGERPAASEVRRTLARTGGTVTRSTRRVLAAGRLHRRSWAAYAVPGAGLAAAAAAAFVLAGSEPDHATQPEHPDAVSVEVPSGQLHHGE